MILSLQFSKWPHEINADNGLPGVVCAQRNRSSELRLLMSWTQWWPSLPFPLGPLLSSGLGGAPRLYWTLKSLHVFSLQKKRISLEGLIVWQRKQHRKKLGCYGNPGQDCPSHRHPWSAFFSHMSCRSVFYISLSPEPEIKTFHP